MENKKLKRGYIEFIGSNTEEVTGSAALIRFLDYAILVDYGMRQSSKDAEDYLINSKRHKDLKPKKLDAVILTHAHLDHSGLVPALFKDGCECPVYVAKGTKKLLTLMWQDCVKIFHNDQERYNRAPIYTQDDVDDALAHIIECDLAEIVQINENISIKMINAQHIVKARQLLVTLSDGNFAKKVGFTGDWSAKKELYWLDDKQEIETCDMLIAETTYGARGRLHKSRDRKTDINKIQTAVEYAIEKKGKIIIPTFSLHRLQTMLAVLYEIYGQDAPIRILVDSPLGHSISDIWEYLIDKDYELWQQIKNWEDVYWITNFKDSMHFNAIKEPMIVLCGGAFLQGGRAAYWVKENLSFKDNYIIFCGYSTPDSPAGQIKSGKLKEIKIDGKTIKNKAKVLTLNSFSSHADRKDLLDYYTQKVQYNKICLVHGEQKSKLEFEKELKEALSKANRTSKVVIAQKDGRVHL